MSARQKFRISATSQKGKRRGLLTIPQKLSLVHFSPSQHHQPCFAARPILCCLENATFTIKFNTQPGENVYLCGSAPELGEWNITKAKKMSWNCGNTWDVEVGFEHDARLQYKYFVQVDETKDIRWEKISNRDVYVNGDGTVFEDKWDSLSPAVGAR